MRECIIRLPARKYLLRVYRRLIIIITALITLGANRFIVSRDARKGCRPHIVYIGNNNNNLNRHRIIQLKNREETTAIKSETNQKTNSSFKNIKHHFSFYTIQYFLESFKIYFSKSTIFTFSSEKVLLVVYV